MSLEVLGGVGEVAKKGRGGPQSGRNLLKGGGTGVTLLCIVDLSNFGSDGENGGGGTHGFSGADQGGESAE